MKPCENIDFTTGKRCPNGATALSIIDDFINDKMLNEVKPVIAYYNIAQASELELIDTTAAKIRHLNNEKKDINKKLDNLIEMQLVMGVNQRLINTGNKLNYRLQKIEEELQNIDVDTDRNEQNIN